MPTSHTCLQVIQYNFGQAIYNFNFYLNFSFCSLKTATVAKCSKIERGEGRAGQEGSLRLATGVGYRSLADDFPGNASSSSSPRSLVRYHAQSVVTVATACLLRVFFFSVYIFRIRAPKGMQHYLYDSWHGREKWKGCWAWKLWLGQLEAGHTHT